MPRFVLSFMEDGKGLITGDEARHLLRVHRVRIGEHISVSWQGAPFDAVVGGTQADAVEVSVLRETHPVEPELSVRLLPAVLKGDKLDLVIQKSVELGVSSIQPVHCERSIVPLSKSRERADRYARIAVEAAKQSGRTRVPEVAAGEPLLRALADAPPGLRLIAHESGGVDLGAVLAGNEGVSSVTLAVGPEGGFTQMEIEQAVASGYIPVGLGPRILRAETASLALLAIIMYQLGDIG